MERPKTPTVSVLMIGAPGSGRQWLRMRYVREAMPFDDWDPPIEDPFVKYIDVGGTKIGFDPVRVAGIDECRQPWDQYYEKCDGVMFCFDLSRLTEEPQLTICFDEYDRILRLRNIETFENIVFVGCKCDRVPEKELQTVLKYAKEMINNRIKLVSGSPRLFVTSASQNIQVTEAFEAVIRGPEPNQDHKTKCVVS